MLRCEYSDPTEFRCKDDAIRVLVRHDEFMNEYRTALCPLHTMDAAIDAAAEQRELQWDTVENTEAIWSVSYFPEDEAPIERAA